MFPLSLKTKIRLVFPSDIPPKRENYQFKQFAKRHLPPQSPEWPLAVLTQQSNRLLPGDRVNLGLLSATTSAADWSVPS